jgi:hypothetical protein
MSPDVCSSLMAAAVVLLVACPAFAAEWNQWGGSPSRPVLLSGAGGEIGRRTRFRS